MLRSASVFLFCCIAAAADLTPEVLLLQRVRFRMSETLTKLPNYTCLQTIERSVRSAPNKKEKPIDTVKLEVAMVDGKELFAWPGSRRFQDTEIHQMVAGGATGTGSFGGFAKAVFQSRLPRFDYKGLVERQGKQAHRWDYFVGQIVSNYSLRIGDREAVVGYHGSFWVDPQSLDVQRLEVIADDIPTSLGISAAEEAIEYSRVLVDGQSFLLPSASEMRMTSLRDSTNINRTTWSSCKHYSGESTVSFEDPDADVPAKPTERSLTSPAGLTLELALEERVDSGKLAVGDPVYAVLRKSLRIGEGVVAPKGARVRGRVTHFSQRYMYRYAGYAIGLDLSELQWENTTVTLNAELDRLVTPLPTIMTAPLTRADADQRIMGSIIFVRAAAPPVLQKGMQMIWRTVAAPAED